MKLDVGCGNYKHGDIGVDLLKSNCTDVVCDAEFLPFRNSSFSEVCSHNVLEHSPNPLNFLKEQYRVLKNGGKINCITDNAQYYKWSVLKFRGEKHERMWDNHYNYNKLAKSFWCMVCHEFVEVKL